MACKGKGGVDKKQTVEIGSTGRKAEVSTGETRNKERLPERDLEGYVECWEEKFCVEEEILWEYQAVCKDKSIEVIATAKTWRRTSDCWWRSMHEKHEPTKDTSEKAVRSILLNPKHIYTCTACDFTFRYRYPVRIQHCPVCHTSESKIKISEDFNELPIHFIEQKDIETCSLSSKVLGERLSELLDCFIEEGLKFVPECDKEYRTHVYNRVLVKDCNNITEEEKREMSDALIAKGRQSAQIICSLNKECPNPKLLRYQFDRIVCENRLWEVDLTWFFKCLK